MKLTATHNYIKHNYYFTYLKRCMLDETFRRTCFCVAVFPLECGVALDRHVSVLQCFLKCGVALDRHVSVLQCFLSSVALL